MEDNFNYDDIDFDKHKRGKSKSSPKRWSIFIIEGIIVLVAVVAGGRFLFSDPANQSDLQATVAAQPTQALSLTAQDLFDRALIEKSERLTTSAIQSLTYALELDPEFAAAYFERAELYYSDSQYYRAEQDYESALRYAYDDTVYATFRLGMARFHRDDYWNAIGNFDEVIERDPDYIDGYYWRGRANIEFGNYQAGIDDLTRALDMGYDEPEYAYFFIATAYDDLGDYDAAIENYTTSLTYSSENCETYRCWIDYNNRGTSYFWSGNYEAAIEEYTQAIQVNPDEYPLALKNRGDAYEALGEMTLALSDQNTMFQLLENGVQTYQLTDERLIVRANLPTNDAQAYIEFEGETGDTITVNVTIPENSYLNTMLILRDPNGIPVAYHAPGDSYEASLNDVTLRNDGTYTIVLASNLANSNGDFVLELKR